MNATNTIDRLGTMAAEAAMRAAAEYIRGRRVPITDELVGKLTEILRAGLRAGLDDAMADAREAIDAGMGHAADATFMASMRLIGIRAAKCVA